jgi:hypothetical protein
MKMVYLIVISFLGYFGCNEAKRENDRVQRGNNLLSSIILIDIYAVKNYCPAYTLLSPGITTISLKEGEEYWFDITPRIGDPDNRVTLFQISVLHSSGQDITAAYESCLRNGSILGKKSEPNSVKPESVNANTQTFLFPLSINNVHGSVLGIIKSKTGSGSVTVTIPSRPSAQY